MTQPKQAGIDKQQLIRGMLEMAVLAALEPGDKYGAQLLLEFEKTIFVSKVGTLYPLLNRMEKQGLIAATWRTDIGVTPRKYYALSTAGRTKLGLYRQFIDEIKHFMGGNEG